MNDNLENQDWPRIIKELTLYAHSRLKFWGLVKNKRLKGYTAKDIALSAIEAVLSRKWHWDATKSDLNYYLKFHVVKGMVANLAKDLEIRTSSDGEWSELDKESEFNQEDEYNSTLVMSQVHSALKEESLLPEIAELLSQGLKRSDICKMLSISTAKYDSSIKRIRTRILRLEKMGIFKA